MSEFEAYVDQVLTADEVCPEPTCPFPANNGECYVDRRAPWIGCIDCVWAMTSFQMLDADES